MWSLCTFLWKPGYLSKHSVHVLSPSHHFPVITRRKPNLQACPMGPHDLTLPFVHQTPTMLGHAQLPALITSLIAWSPVFSLCFSHPNPGYFLCSLRTLHFSGLTQALPHCLPLWQSFWHCLFFFFQWLSICLLSKHRGPWEIVHLSNTTMGTEQMSLSTYWVNELTIVPRSSSLLSMIIMEIVGLDKWYLKIMKLEVLFVAVQE